MTDNVFEASTVEEALEQAAAKFNLPVDELQHEVVDEKTEDFWGLGGKVFVVRAWPLAPAQPEEPVAEEPVEAPAPATPVVEPAAETERAAEPVAEPVAVAASPEPASDPAPAQEPAAPEETPARAVEPAAPTEAVSRPEAAPVRDGSAVETGALPSTLESDGELADAAVQLLDSIFGNMDFDCKAAASVQGDTLQVAITGEDNQFLLDGRGRGLSALELILNHALRLRVAGGHRKIRVDAGDFRSQRDDELRDLAFQVAHQAKETDTEQQTRPLNPYERRIVHLTLADDPRVTTRSLGSGFTKTVNVIPRPNANR